MEYNGVTGYAMAQYLERIGAQDAGENDQDAGEDAQKPENVTIPRLKLLEVQACLNDCQNIVKNYLQ